MDWRLEVIPVPVSDVERAKHFYSQQLGFIVDLDTQISDTMRVVQLTPPGSACSIHLSSGFFSTPPGSVQGLQITVSDLEMARSELVERGVEVSPIRYVEMGAPGDVEQLKALVFFSDPDGNWWVVQEHLDAMAV